MTNRYHQDGYPLLFASEESLQDVSRTVQQAASSEDGPMGRIGGIDRERWKDTSVEIERFDLTYDVRPKNISNSFHIFHADSDRILLLKVQGFPGLKTYGEQ